MKKTPIQKINGLGKAAYIISKITKVFLIIAAVFILIAGILVFAMPTDFMSIRLDSQADISLDYSFSNTSLDKIIDDEDLLEDWEINGIEYEVEEHSDDGRTIHLSARAEKTTLNVWHLRLLMIAGLILTTAVCVGTHFLCDLFKALSVSTTPFEESIIQKMRRLAIALIPVSIISGSMKELIDSLQTGDITIGISIDFTQVVVILVLFALVYIFKHGAELQQESDEPL